MKEIRIKDDEGDLLVRDSFVITFFCRKPLREVAQPFAACFERWLKIAPVEAKRWCLVGSNADTYRPLTGQRLAKAQRQFDMAKVRAGEVRGFDLGGPQQINSDYWFSFTGLEELEGNEASYLEIHFPTAVLDSPGVPFLLKFVQQAAELVPYDSGYASLGLTYGIESQLIEYSEAVRGLAFRHPGLDVAINKGTAFDIAEKLRGAYWLTFIGQEALAVLGGPQKLRKKLDRKISMVPVGVGWMLQAGEKPEPGDVNRGQTLPLLRSLAKVLEPVMHFNDEALGHIFNTEDDEDLERWERRFLPEYGDEDEEASEDEDV